MKVFWALFLVWFLAGSTGLHTVTALNCTYYCGSLSAMPVTTNVTSCNPDCSAESLCSQKSFYSICNNETGIIYGYQLDLISDLSPTFGDQGCSSSVELMFAPFPDDPTKGGTILNDSFAFSGSSSFCSSYFDLTNSTGSVSQGNIVVNYTNGSFLGSLPSSCTPDNINFIIIGANGSMTINNEPIADPITLVYSYLNANTASTGLCTYEFQENSGGGGGGTKCFSGSTIVLSSENGETKLMRDLQIGDHIMGVNHRGELVPDQVIGWLHLKRTQPSEFLQIETEGGQVIKVTGQHLIYAHRPTQGSMTATKQGWNAFRAVYAQRIRVGDLVFHARTQTGARVVAIRTVQETGLFAPLTQSGRLVVDGSVASCYGSFASHAVAHAVFAPARLASLRQYMANWFLPSSQSGMMRYAEGLYAIWRALVTPQSVSA
jgi:hypothetical protein